MTLPNEPTTRKPRSCWRNPPGRRSTPNCPPSGRKLASVRAHGTPHDCGRPAPDHAARPSGPHPDASNRALNKPHPMRAPRSPPEPAGVQNLLPSKQCVLRVNDKHQAATAGATGRVGVIESLARQSLAARTADRAIALVDPDLNGTRPRNLDGSKPTFKISHRFCTRLPEAADRIRPPPAL